MSADLLRRAASQLRERGGDADEVLALYLYLASWRAVPRRFPLVIARVILDEQS